MNRYLISGAQRTTGDDTRIELNALSEADARAAATHKGILITECESLDEKKPAVNRNDAYLRESVMWLRFLGISTALGVFAVIVKMIMAH